MFAYMHHPSCCIDRCADRWRRSYAPLQSLSSERRPRMRISHSMPESNMRQVEVQPDSVVDAYEPRDERNDSFVVGLAAQLRNRQPGCMLVERIEGKWIELFAD